jgi:4-amino-4-deoxy-L-arabinose transferase-like glycosyltransferase
VTGVLAAFAAVNLVWLAITGIHTGGDTPLYLDGARALLEGGPLTERQPSYAGYIAIVALSQSIGAGLVGVVLLQVAVATAAAAAVYQLGVEMGGQRAGVIATALLALDMETNRWHAYVLADSLYLSVLTLAVWLVHRASGPPRDWRRYAVASIALVIACVIRPEGWFLLPAAVMYWVVRGESTAPRRLVWMAAIVASCALLVFSVAPRLSGNVAAVDPGEMLRRGQTIWDYNGWRLSMSDAPASDSAVRYLLRHPIDTVELMVARVAVHLAHVRPFYSTVHNAVIVLWLLPVYGFAASAAWALRRRTLARWCGVAFATQALVVALTHADWDGRYLAHVLPIVYPFTAYGVVRARDWALQQRTALA